MVRVTGDGADAPVERSVDEYGLGDRTRWRIVQIRPASSGGTQHPALYQGAAVAGPDSPEKVTDMFVAVPLARSTVIVPVPVPVDVVGGTSCAPERGVVIVTDPVAAGSTWICPRISPFGNAAVWTLK